MQSHVFASVSYSVPTGSDLPCFSDGAEQWMFMRQPKRRKGRGANMNSETTNTAATVSEQGAHVAPEKAPSKKAATRKKGAPKGQKTAKDGKIKKQAKAASKTASRVSSPRDSSVPREGSKKAAVLELLRRKNGATLAEIAKTTKWQSHTIRGFISIAGKQQGTKIESSRNEAGVRVYKLGK
jgi:hypothetical protein